MKIRYRPFAGAFAVESQLSPGAAKTAIRGGLANWFTINAAPRGWIIGPFFCLWLSKAGGKARPLLGYITHRNWRTHAVGIPVADIYGIAFIAGVAVCAFFLLIETLNGTLSAMGTVPIGLCMLIALFVFLIFPREQAVSPLVVYLRHSLQSREAKAKPIALPRFDVPALKMRLNISGVRSVPDAQIEDVAVALDQIAAGEESFLILEDQNAAFMQSAYEAAYQEAGFMVEKGSPEKDGIARARHRGDAPHTPLDQNAALTILLAFLHGTAEPDFVAWDTIPL